MIHTGYSEMTATFADRQEAGRLLGRALATYQGADPIVLGLARGGVPVAKEVAQILGAPLDVLVVRKLSTPWRPELGIGALGEGGVRVLNQALIEAQGLDPDAVERIAATQEIELERRVKMYRSGKPRHPIAGRVVIVVDDGLATGFTARAAIEVLRRGGAASVVLAVPVAPVGTVEEMSKVADAVVCMEIPPGFASVGENYRDFHQTTDEEVAAMLNQVTLDPATDEADPPPAADRHVVVPAAQVSLGGHLSVPEGARGIVIFAHGSGSSRLSPRNISVALTLNKAGLGTLLFDLLTEQEAAKYQNVFDVALLASRLEAATRWVQAQPECRELPIGYFGASTGAAAAMAAAAEFPSAVSAVVSRGGRPDLASSYLPSVKAPTLLIVGGLDPDVLELNRRAQEMLRCDNRLEIVPGATHLFEQPGALTAVAGMATTWFTANFRVLVLAV
jgi:putative phosphoribosyl transferase